MQCLLKNACVYTRYYGMDQSIDNDQANCACKLKDAVVMHNNESWHIQEQHLGLGMLSARMNQVQSLEEWQTWIR